MLIACWSVKGGSGTTAVAAALGLVLARRHPEGAVLADLAGEAPAVLGLAEREGPGLTEWLMGGAAVESLPRLAVEADRALAVLPRGAGAWPATGEVVEAMAGGLRALDRPVVLDCGSQPRGLRASLIAAADSSLLVLRPCYLAVRLAMAHSLRPNGLVVVSEPGRSLSSRDLADVLGVPVRAEVLVEPAVARAIDAGLLAARLPRGLERALRRAA